jgi:single-strand DNA-binding protein
MRGVNKVILIGHLGKDPEMQTFEGGNMLCKFSLATSEVFKDKAGNKQEKTEWHNIVIWGALADVAQKYLRKGAPVYLEGKINNRSYDDKDGNKKYITEIRVENMQMLGGKDGASNSGGGYQSNNNNSAPANSSSPAESMMNSDIPADDLPF